MRFARGGNVLRHDEGQIYVPVVSAADHYFLVIPGRHAGVEPKSMAPPWLWIPGPSLRDIGE
jgi:hypothetical protein